MVETWKQVYFEIVFLLLKYIKNVISSSRLEC